MVANDSDEDKINLGPTSRKASQTFESFPVTI